MSTHVKIRIEPDELDLPGNRHHCAIANAIMLADPDIVYVRVDEDNIRFSRRSTGTRYAFTTPAKAAAFIREFDRLITAGDGGGKIRAMTARPFTLELTDDHLIDAVPRRERNANYAVQRAAVKSYGPTLAGSPVAKAISAGAVKATPVVEPKPVRKMMKATPRRRPSVRAS